MIKGFNTHVSLSEIENRKSKIYVVCGVCVCVCAGVVGGGGGAQIILGPFQMYCMQRTLQFLLRKVPC